MLVVIGKKDKNTLQLFEEDNLSFVLMKQAHSLQVLLVSRGVFVIFMTCSIAYSTRTLDYLIVFSGVLAVLKSLDVCLHIHPSHQLTAGTQDLCMTVFFCFFSLQLLDTRIKILGSSDPREIVAAH